MDITPFREKMAAAGLGETAIRCFSHYYAEWTDGVSALFPESAIQPIDELPTYEQIAAQTTPDAALPEKTAILKLNGGLGTGMGLAGAKSLLPVRPGLNFLDLIARQIAALAPTPQSPRPAFFLLNSFSTSADTRAWLSGHPALGPAEAVELLQNKIPKIDAQTRGPVSWPAQPDLEWCPPGHGDIYTVLGTGPRLAQWRERGLEYLFVSNADNLGATPDPAILTWFAQSGAPFLMEVTARTPSDRKGGHLARQGDRLLLRESAQCPSEDEAAFQDITRHRFFNTNNLWLRLDTLEALLREQGGFLPLPLIANAKTVDPRDSKSPSVIQLESAMGAAVGVIPGSRALCVPRSRFSPVKTTSDLLGLRSDAYEITQAGLVVLAGEFHGVPPRITLDGTYKLVDALEKALSMGVPSLRHCRALTLRGPVQFEAGVVCRGEVTVENSSAEWRTLPAGVYENETVTL